MTETGSELAAAALHEAEHAVVQLALLDRLPMTVRVRADGSGVCWGGTYWPLEIHPWQREAALRRQLEDEHREEAARIAGVYLAPQEPSSGDEAGGGEIARDLHPGDVAGQAAFLRRARRLGWTTAQEHAGVVRLVAGALVERRELHEPQLRTLLAGDPRGRRLLEEARQRIDAAWKEAGLGDA
jgi:hypothetical protein